MIKRINNFLFKKRLTLFEIDANSLDELKIDYPALFNDINNVLIVKKFHPPLEISKIKKNIETIDHVRLAEYGGRYTAIPSVFETKKLIQDPEYFDNCQAALSYFEKCIQVNLNEKYTTLFKQLGNNHYTVENPQLSKNLSPFVFGCLRIIPPSYGVINIHADNDFYTNKEELYKYFLSQVNTSNHVSYISMIQKPKKGGNLVLHDLDFTDYYKVDDTYAYHRNGVKKKLSSFASFEINLDEGDLVLFSGGRYWHSVNKIQDNTERITFGGFSALSNDNESIYLWT